MGLLYVVGAKKDSNNECRLFLGVLIAVQFMLLKLHKIDFDSSQTVYGLMKKNHVKQERRLIRLLT